VPDQPESAGPSESPGPPAAPPSTDQPTADDRQWAMYAHLAGLPLSVLGPFLILNVHKTPYVERHAKEALNFQINVLAIYALGLVLAIVGAGTLVIIGGMVFSLICAALAGVKASNGEWFVYPLVVRPVR
jgi:hypothetical protein